MRFAYRAWFLVLLVLIYFSLLSCLVPVSSPRMAPVKPDWLDKTTSVTPGKTNRASVRNLLGDPFLSSDYWNLDIFRQSAKRYELTSSPAFTYYRYTLITYDENNIVNDIGTGLTYASLRGRVSTRLSYRLSLYVGHFIFIYDRQLGEFLFLNSPNTVNYLQSLRPLTECIAIIHADVAYLTYLITSDNGKRKVVRPIPLRTLATLMLSSGRYTFEVTQGWHVLDRDSQKSFNCDKGDVVYIDIRVAYERRAFWKQIVTLKDFTATYRIDLYDEMPEAFVDLSQIILSDGQWIVNPAQGSYSPETLFTNASQKKIPSQNPNTVGIRKDAGIYCPNADLGHTDAQLYIAKIYEYGTSEMQINLVRAWVWYSLAAQNGDAQASEQLPRVTSELTSEQLQEAKRQLALWEPGQCIQELTADRKVQ